MGESAPEGRIHIAAACDANYAMPLAVMLASVAANLGDGRRVVAYVLESGLSIETKHKVAKSVPDERVAIQWISVQADRLAHHRGTLRSFDTVSVVAYFRLLLPEMVPENLDRVIYLDCDLVVTHDLWDLWTVDIGSTSLGAVPEQISSARYASSRAGIRLYRELGLRPDQELFNSGVMLLNLAKWRETQVASRALTYLREAALYLRWHDQEALNAVVAGDWTPIDACWNVTMHVYRDSADSWLAELARTSCIVHFNAAIKPWQAAFRGARRELFYRYLDDTAWAGWRPAQPRIPVLPRWAARVVRASRKVRHAVGRRLQIARARLHGWRILHGRPRQISGRAIPRMQTREIRVFMTAATVNPNVAGIVEHYLALGADRVLLLAERLDESSRRAAESHQDRLHVFMEFSGREKPHERLRQLLHRHGQGHWCVLVDDDEWLLRTRSGSATLRDLRDYLEQHGYEALECQLRCDDVTSTERHRPVAMTAADPLHCRVFCVTVSADTSVQRIAELACRSKVALLRYRAGMLIDRELRGVSGARMADVAGVILESRATAAGANPTMGRYGIARWTPASAAFAAQELSREPAGDRPAAAPAPRS